MTIAYQLKMTARFKMFTGKVQKTCHQFPESRYDSSYILQMEAFTHSGSVLISQVQAMDILLPEDLDSPVRQILLEKLPINSDDIP